MSKIDLIEKDYLKKEVPEFQIGDEVKVHLKVREGDKTRTQIFAGTVIRKRGRGVSTTFTVLKEVRGETVEKTIPLHSPNLEKIQVSAKGKVRRSKLYYLRQKHASES